MAFGDLIKKINGDDTHNQNQNGVTPGQTQTPNPESHIPPGQSYNELTGLSQSQSPRLTVEEWDDIATTFNGLTPDLSTQGAQGDVPLAKLTNTNNNVDLFLNLNPEQQRLKQSKLMKKALRARAPKDQDANMPIFVDGFKIPREVWAKGFVQADICDAARILFKALFTTEEILSCTLRGRNGTEVLSPPKRNAIYRAVGWMKNKNQNPYSFDSNLSTSSMLSPEEKNMIEKKVFVERRYQLARKMIRINSLPISQRAG